MSHGCEQGQSLCKPGQAAACLVFLEEIHIFHPPVPLFLYHTRNV